MCLKTQAGEGERPREPKYDSEAAEVRARGDARPPKRPVFRQALSLQPLAFSLPTGAPIARFLSPQVAQPQRLKATSWDHPHTAPIPPPYRLACCKAPLSNLPMQNPESRMATQSRSRPPPCDLKATPMRVDSQPIATPRPPQSANNATPKPPQGHPNAPTRLPQSANKASSQVASKPPNQTWRVLRYATLGCVSSQVCSTK